MSQKKPRSWKATLGMAALVVAGAGAGYIAGGALKKIPTLGHAFGTLSAWDLLALPVLMLVVVAVHEGGHLLGGLSRGMRPLLYVAGPFGWVRTPSGIRFRWFLQLGTLGGLVAAMPSADQPLKPQLQRLVVGGPLASLLLAVLGAGLFITFEGRASVHALALGLLSLAIFTITALPFRAGGFMSDGMQLLQLERDPAHVERRVHLMGLMGMSLAGTRPRDLDAGLLAQAQALSGAELLADVGVWLYSYAHALDKGDLDGAESWLQRMAAVFDDYPDGFRQSLAVELALFEALHRQRLPAALSWQARSKGGIVDASRRQLANAAIALLQENRSETMRCLDLAERKLAQAMDPGLGHLSTDQLAILKQSLGTAVLVAKAA